MGRGNRLVATPLLLDSCAAIWLANGDPLGEASRAALDEALRAGSVVAVSPITAWEIGLLSARGRLLLATEPSTWFRSLIALPGISLAPLTPDLMIQSSYLPGSPPNDPADRILAATARSGYRLVTRDRLRLSYAEAGHIAAIAC